MATLIYSAQCPNCTRFIESLDRVPSGAGVKRIEVSRLPPEMYQRVAAVPTLVLENGQQLVGSKAFEWLKQFDAEVELDGWGGGNGLAYAPLEGDQYVQFAPRFGDF
jgi:hypothetical protein